jgi:hypothetical protein
MEESCQISQGQESLIVLKGCHRDRTDEFQPLMGGGGVWHPLITNWCQVLAEWKQEQEFLKVYGGEMSDVIGRRREMKEG